VRTTGATLARRLPRPALRASVERLVPSARPLRWLLALLALAALPVGAYRVWFRESSLVGVETVTVTGLRSSHAPRLREALTAEARTMTTLSLRRDRLEKLAATYPVVRSLQVRSDFPHRLRIHVTERRPAAMVMASDARVPVAGDGVLLPGYPVEGALPRIELSGVLPEKRLREPLSLHVARVLGAAPAGLTPRLRDVVDTGERGLVVRPRAGPELVLGDPTRLRAKWAAAARMLAEPGARGVAYIDVRLPERPAVPGAPESGPPDPPAVNPQP
jgi:cell division protein FtsQ